MFRTRLYLKGISEIVGNIEMSIIVLVDENQERQLSIVCDKQTEYQISMRMSGMNITQKMVPEVLLGMIRKIGDYRLELIINTVSDGGYNALLVNKDTMDVVSMRASDAVLLSLIGNIPLFVDESLMARQSVPFREDTKGMAIPVNVLDENMLTKALEKAVEEENYELASHLRDELKRRKIPSSR